MTSQRNILPFVLQRTHESAEGVHISLLIAQLWRQVGVIVHAARLKPAAFPVIYAMSRQGLGPVPNHLRNRFSHRGRVGSAAGSPPVSDGVTLGSVTSRPYAASLTRVVVHTGAPTVSSIDDRRRPRPRRRLVWPRSGRRGRALHANAEGRLISMRVSMRAAAPHGHARTQGSIPCGIRPWV